MTRAGNRSLALPALTAEYAGPTRLFAVFGTTSSGIAGELEALAVPPPVTDEHWAVLYDADGILAAADGPNPYCGSIPNVWARGEPVPLRQVVAVAGAFFRWNVHVQPQFPIGDSRQPAAAGAGRRAAPLQLLARGR